MNLADGFYSHVESSPESPALLLGDTSLNYTELAGRVVACQTRLQTLLSTGAASQSTNFRIAWNGPNSVALVVLYLTCLRAGYTLVLLDPSWPSAAKESALNSVSPSLIVGPEHDLFAQASSMITRDVAQLANAEASAFLIGFTSGSSGRPKPFIRSQASWLDTFSLAAKEFGAKPGHRVLAPGPLSHGLSFYAMAETLHHGGQFIGLPQFDVGAVVALLESHDVHTLVVVPTMLVALLKQLASHHSAGAPARIISAGAKLSVSLRATLARQFPHTELTEYYGASELSFVTVSQASESPPPQSVGRAFAGVEIKLLKDDGSPASHGESGRVWVRSGMLADGYLEADGSVQSLVDAAGWSTVGDVGVFDKDGFLSLIDRASNMLISGGLNVYPADVERILEQHDAVAEAVVVGLPDTYWGDRVCAVLRWEQSQQQADETDETLRALIAICRDQLSPEQRPACFYTVSQWPLTHSGKIDRQVLVQSIRFAADVITPLELRDD